MKLDSMVDNFNRHIKLKEKLQKKILKVLSCKSGTMLNFKNSNCFMHDEMVDFPKLGYQVLPQ